MTAVPKPVSFDDWRSKYDIMSYDEHVAYYRDVWKNYPNQKHFNVPAINIFFEDIEQGCSVLELGGWRGEVASIVFPHLLPKRWLNVEICEGAVENSVLESDAYKAVVLGDWIWNQQTDFFKGFDVMFASHSFEHVRGHELAKLLDLLPKSIKWLYVDAPLRDDDQSWDGYLGTHILEWGWDHLQRELEQRGWERFGVNNSARMFSR